MTQPAPTDYDLSDEDASSIQGATLLPVGMRRDILTKYLGRRGPAALVNLFAQFMGLANSVVANNREMCERLLVEQGMHPQEAEKVNLPTIFGALCGIPIAHQSDGRGLCAGCAYRLGTPANQSPITTADAAWCSNDGEATFFCHERLDAHGNPIHPCAGHTQHRKAQSLQPTS